MRDVGRGEFGERGGVKVEYVGYKVLFSLRVSEGLVSKLGLIRLVLVLLAVIKRVWF